MKFEDMNIATARINGLNEPPFWFEHQCFFAWNVKLTDTSTLIFYLPTFIKVGKDEEEATEFCNKIKQNFKEAGIHDGDRVGILFRKDGHVRAICPSGKNVWIDLDDQFSKKTFEELDIIITSLKVY